MKNTQKTAIILVTFLFVACQKNLAVKTENPAALPAVSASMVTANLASQTTVAAASIAVAMPDKTEAVKDWLAKLLKQTNQVEHRKRNQNVWTPAEAASAFMKYDALQTKASSNAEVVYQSGSTLDVKENTLIIFDEDPGQRKKAEDRVIIKTGQLTGKTKTELWVFTDAGLVQIKAKKASANKAAEAKVTVNKDRAINIKVNQGTAEVIYKKENEFNRIGVAEMAEITLTPSTAVTSGLLVNEQNIHELATAKVKAPPAAQADIHVEFPPDNALVNDFEIEVRGNLTGAGAKLLLNGQLAELSHDGKFTKKVGLQAGTNLLVFQIVRSDGTVKFVKRSVRYQPR